MSKCAGNTVWGLSSTFTCVIIYCLLQSFSRSNKEFRAGFHVSTWSKLLRTLIPRCFCHSDSIPSITFLCFNPLSLATISAFPQSTPLWHSTVCRARSPSSLLIRFSADRVFPYEGIHLLVWRCPCVLSFLFGKGAMFLLHTQYSSRYKESSWFTTNFCLSPSGSWPVR